MTICIGEHRGFIVQILAIRMFPLILAHACVRAQKNADPEVLFTKMDRVGKGSFGEVFKGYVSPTA